MTNACYEIRIPADHPALPGHFPGNPVVPGATLLAELGARVGSEFGPVRGVRRVRFSRPVRPGDAVIVDCRAAGVGQVRFDCRVGGEQVARGILVCPDANGDD